MNTQRLPRASIDRVCFNKELNTSRDTRRNASRGRRVSNRVHRRPGGTMGSRGRRGYDIITSAQATRDSRETRSDNFQFPQMPRAYASLCLCLRSHISAEKMNRGEEKRGEEGPRLVCDPRAATSAVHAQAGKLAGWPARRGSSTSLCNRDRRMQSCARTPRAPFQRG